MNRRDFLKQSFMAGVVALAGVKPYDKPEYPIFDIECREYILLETWASQPNFWLPEYPHLAAMEQQAFVEFKRDFITFHGARAIQWIANKEAAGE